MTQKTSSRDYQGHSYLVKTSQFSGLQPYDLNALLMWKGSERIFKTNVLLLVKSIDLSSNHFSGEIPQEIENLFGLVSLNLSRNNLIGITPSKIGKLTSLESLDLSRNHLVGSIPPSLTQIYWLSVLDLSHNHLTGKIPTRVMKIILIFVDRHLRNCVLIRGKYKNQILKFKRMNIHF